MELIYYPNPILMKKTSRIEPGENELREKIRAMFEIMYANKGIGLAGPQAGWSKRLFILNIDGTESETEMVFINPRIVSHSGTLNEEEGCLSFPGIYIRVKRHKELMVEYEDLDGNVQRLPCEGLLARAVQHEIDHLDNILLIHRMSHTDRIRNKKYLDELKMEYQASLEAD